MTDLEKLTELFKQFPGIGERQAKRFVYFLLRKSPRYREELSDAIKTITSNIRQCPESFQYFSPKMKDQILSPIILDTSRDKGKLVVVERDSDLEAIERSGAFDGHYFVLGGSIPILEKEPNKAVRLHELLAQVSKRLENKSLREVILAFSLTPQGEHTEDIVKQALLALTSGAVKISVLGRGLSTGSELEYTDKMTLGNAFENRH
jgi:recombination protein RecR